MVRGSLTNYSKTLGKRANLASVQMSAVVPAAGYSSIPYRTGYESVIGSRLDKDFVFNALEDGVVKSIKKDYIAVEYKSGKKDGSILGVSHGSVAGKFISHFHETDFKEGDTFKVGSVIAWNRSFFERDFFSKTNVTMKIGALLTVAMLESNDTLEDGCAVDKKTAKLLSTKLTKQRTIVLTFDQELVNAKKLGDTVHKDDVLGTIVDTGIGVSDYDDKAIAALARLANTSPKAKLSGLISNMDLVYYGDIDDMSPGLQGLCKAENKRRGAIAKNTGDGSSPTAEVKDRTFFGGEEILENTVAIRYFIDDDGDCGIGDKLVIGNQLKSIVGREMVGQNTTADGRPINVIFGWNSVNARIVLSPIKMGVVCTTCEAAMGRMIELYEK